MVIKLPTAELQCISPSSLCSSLVCYAAKLWGIKPEEIKLFLYENSIMYTNILPKILNQTDSSII